MFNRNTLYTHYYTPDSNRLDMQTLNGNQNIPIDDPTWYPIAELSLDEVVLNQEKIVEFTAEPLIQTIRELSLPVEYIKRIEGTITEAIRGVNSSLNYCEQGPSVCIYLYFKKKLMDSVQQTGDQMNGGWGYYLIERNRDLLNGCCEQLCRVVEVYLYNEGE